MKSFRCTEWLQRILWRHKKIEIMGFYSNAKLKQSLISKAFLFILFLLCIVVLITFHDFKQSECSHKYYTTSKYLINDSHSNACPGYIYGSNHKCLRGGQALSYKRRDGGYKSHSKCEHKNGKEQSNLKRKYL